MSISPSGHISSLTASEVGRSNTGPCIDTERKVGSVWQIPLFRSVRASSSCVKRRALGQSSHAPCRLRGMLSLTTGEMNATIQGLMGSLKGYPIPQQAAVELFSRVEGRTQEIAADAMCRVRVLPSSGEEGRVE